MMRQLLLLLLPFVVNDIFTKIYKENKNYTHTLEQTTMKEKETKNDRRMHLCVLSLADFFSFQFYRILD